MNREIKFRGKSLKYGNWLFGSLWIDGEKCYIINEKESEKAGENSWYDTYVTGVDPSAVGQYTGLKDKNGTEIYEGDIVSVSVKSRNTVEVYTIAYDKERACFGLEKEYCGEKYISAFASWDEPSKDLFPYMSLIGNIYENTESIN